MKKAELRIKQKAQYDELLKRLNRYMLSIRGIYDELAKEVAKIVIRIGYDGTGEFSFAKYPSVRNAIKKLLDTYEQEMLININSFTGIEWKNSNTFQTMLAKEVLKGYSVVLNSKRAKKYFLSNNDAYKEFQKRVISGMNLSQRIWSQRDDVRKSLEATISLAVEKGTSAVKLSKKISKYLQDYPSIKKDYKEKFGKATDIKNCEYNSMRLARSEINMAYRNAEQLRWRQMDFILGYSIHTSAVHGHEHSDMCDELQGDYPLWFNWDGWHPNCMCYAVPILATKEEYLNFDSSRKLDDVPDNFKLYIMNNRDRINTSSERGTLPYFIQNNRNVVDNLMQA